MSRISKRLEGMISAASFAEAGEFETAREMLDGNRKVLLVLTGRETDVKSLKYAFSIAERTGAGLEVLAAEGSSTAEMLRLGEEKARQHGVPLKVTKKSGCIKEAVIKYARGRRDLVCVVIESTDALNSDCSSEQKRLSGIWEKLGCPLALVSEKSINEQEGALS